MAYLYKSPTQPDGSGGNDNVPSITGDSDFDKYLSSLPQEQKQKELDAYNAPPSGEELNSIMAQKNADGELFHMSTEQYKTWKEYRKGQEIDVLHGLAEGANSILHDFGNAVGTMASHPLTSTVKAVPSFVEAFTQGTRNLYGMLAQSEDPNSTLFKFKDVISGKGSDINAEYNQFMDAQRFRLNSQDLASGKSTLLLNKDYIDHDMTQAMSYVADPTLFIPFGVLGSAGMKAVGLGATLAKVGAITSHLKGLAYGGALKLAGVPLEFIGGATRNVIDKTIAGGGIAAEAITGVSAKDIAQTVKVTALGTTGAAIAGHGGIIAGVGSVYLGAGGAAGLGEALSAMGTQAIKNKGARGMLTLAESALAESAAIVEKGGSGLSQHATNLLKIINTVDPMFAYANAAVTGVAHGAVIGGTLGYLNAGKEGMAHGIGAGMALGGIGALGGKLFADLSGGTNAAHAKIQREMVQALLKESDPVQYAHNEMILKHAELNGWNADRYIAAMDKVASGVKTEARDSNGIADLIRAHGEDPETYKGFKTKDGQPVLDADGNRVRLVDSDGFRIPTIGEFDSANGFVLTKGGKDGKDFKVHLNLASMSKYTLPHELFHTVFKKMVIEPDFQKRLNNALLGEYDANGNMITAPKISKEDARQFYRTYIEHLYSDKATPEAERITKLQRDFRHERLDEALDEYYKTGKMTVESPDHKGTPLLHAMGEEFGAHYFAHFIEAKPLDYLFRGADLGGIRGIIENTKDAWASHWEGQAKRVNPSLNIEGMSADIHGGFVNRNGKRIRVQALDYLMRDLIRARSQIKGKGFDVRTLSPEAQKTYITSNGLNRRYKKDENTGNYRPRTKEEQAAHDKQSGVEAKKILTALPAGDRTSVSDPKTGDITGVLSEKEINALVNNGLLDHAEGVTIKTIQNIASNPNGGNVGTLMYHGYSQQTAVGYDARVFRPNTTARARKVLIHGYESRIDDKGNFSFRAKTLDLEAMELNQDRQWSNPEVRKHWKDDKTAFIADFYKYLENASKPATDITRRPSAEILGENGAEKRNVLHQVAAFASSDTKQFKNTPTAKIPRDIRQSFMDLRSDAMSDLRIENGNKIIYDHQNAHEDIQTNFSPRRMKVTDTPEGEIFEHESGYRFLRTKSGETKAYDVTDKHLGTFKTLKEAVDTIKVQYAKEFSAEKPVVSLDNAAAESARDLAPKEPIVLKTREELRQEVVASSLGLGDRISLEVLVTNIASQINHLSKWGGQEHQIAKLQSLIDRAEARIEYYERNAGEIWTPFSDSLEKDIISDYYDKYMDAATKADTRKIADNLHQQQARSEFRSGLVDEIDRLLWNDGGSPNTEMTAAMLLKAIRKGGSKGQRLWTEASHIGLIDFLQAEAKRTVDVIKPYRKTNPETGALFPRGAGEGTYGTQRVGTKIAPLDRAAVLDFIDKNRIKLTIETNPREVRGLDTEHFTMNGTTDGYESSVARINTQYRSGVQGHYGEGVVHTRATFRADSEGNKHTFTEEVQANNAEEGSSNSFITQEQADHANGILLARQKHAIAIDKLYFLEGLASSQRNKVLFQPADISRLLRDISRTEGGKEAIEAKIRDLKSSPTGDKLQTLARIYNGALVDYVKYLKSHYTYENIETFEKEIKKHLSRNDSMGENRPSKTEEQLEKRYQKHIGSLFNIETEYTGGLNTNHNFTLQSLLDGSYYKELLKGKVDEHNPFEILVKFDALGRHFDEFSVYRNDNVPEHPLVPKNQLTVLLRNVIEHTAPYVAENSSGKLGYVANLHEGNSLGSDLHTETNLAHLEGDYDYFRQNVVDRIKKEPFYKDANTAQRHYQSHLEAVKKLIPREVFAHERSAINANLLDGMNTHDDFLTEHQFEALVTDAKTLVDKFKMQGKSNSLPMQNVNDWGIIGLKMELRKAALQGSDYLTLTHPDDSPSISHMAEEKRRALYGEILPNLWDGYLKKYGIKSERVKGKLLAEVKQAHAELAEANAKTSEAVKIAVDEFKRTNGDGNDMSSLYRLSEIISEPTHNLEFNTHGVFATEWYKEGRDILGNLTTGELRNRLSEAFDAKVAEAIKSGNLKEVRKNTGTYSPDSNATDAQISAEVLDRGISWKLTQEVKDAFLRGDADSELTNYSPKKVGESNGRYDHDSKEWKSGFIGKYSASNQEKVKDMNVQFFRRADGSYRLTLSDNSGNTVKVGHITADLNTSMGNKVMEISSNIAPEYRGSGLSYVLYSEMAERMRDMGVQALTGTIVNKDGIPVRVREKIIGDTRRLADDMPISQERAKAIINHPNNGNASVKVYNILEGDAHYSPNKKTYTPSEEGKAKLLETIKANPMWDKAFASGQATIDESRKYIGSGFRWMVHGADTAKASGVFNGGVGFPILHAEGGHGWAGESGAFIKEINAIMDWNALPENKGERVAPMLIKMAHPEKMRGASQGADSGLSRLLSLTKPENGSPITEHQLMTAIRRAYKHTELFKDKDGNTVIDPKTEKNKRVLIQNKQLKGKTLDDVIRNTKEHILGDNKNSQKKNRALIEGTIRELHNQIKELSDEQIKNIKKLVPDFEGKTLSNDEDTAGANIGGFQRALFGSDVEPMSQLGSFSQLGEGSGYAVVLFRETLVDSRSRGISSPHPSDKVSGMTKSGSPVQVDFLSNPQFLGDIFTHQVKQGENIKKLPTDYTIGNVAERNIPMATVYSPKRIRDGGQALIRAIEAQADKDKVPKAITEGVRRLVNATKRQHREDLKEIPQEVKDGVQALKDAIDAHSDNEGIPPKIKAGVVQLVKEAEFGDLQPQSSLPKPTATASQLQSGLEALVGKKLKIAPQKQAQAETLPTVSQDNQQRTETKNPVVLSNSLPPPANTPPPSPQPAPIPSTPAPTSQASKPPAYSTWTMEKTGNNTLYKNSVNYLIMVQADKYKVYNPQRELVGIYSSIEQAKRRVQRDEPKR